MRAAPASLVSSDKLDRKLGAVAASTAELLAVPKEANKAAGVVAAIGRIARAFHEIVSDDAAVVRRIVQVAVSQPVVQQSAAQPRSEQSVNYKDYERPTVQRQSHSGAATAAKLNTQDDLDYLDIPAFLRRQAD